MPIRMKYNQLRNSAYLEIRTESFSYGFVVRDCLPWHFGVILLEALFVVIAGDEDYLEITGFGKVFVKFGELWSELFAEEERRVG